MDNSHQTSRKHEPAQACCCPPSPTAQNWGVKPPPAAFWVRKQQISPWDGGCGHKANSSIHPPLRSRIAGAGTHLPLQPVVRNRHWGSVIHPGYFGRLLPVDSPPPLHHCWEGGRFSHRLHLGPQSPLLLLGEKPRRPPPPALEANHCPISQGTAAPSIPSPPKILQRAQEGESQGAALSFI